MILSSKDLSQLSQKHFWGTSFWPSAWVGLQYMRGISQATPRERSVLFPSPTRSLPVLVKSYFKPNWTECSDNGEDTIFSEWGRNIPSPNVVHKCISWVVAFLVVLSECLHGPKLGVGKLIPSSYWSPIFLLQKTGLITCWGENVYGCPEFKKIYWLQWEGSRRVQIRTELWSHFLRW